MHGLVPERPWWQVARRPARSAPVTAETGTAEEFKSFGFPEEVDEALKTFDACVPNLVRIRDARTHTADTNQLDRIGTFSAAVELHPDGSVTYLVDPRHRHHEAALALLDVVQNYLRRNLRERIASDPAKSVEEQIHERNSRGTS